MNKKSLTLFQRFNCSWAVCVAVAAIPCFRLSYRTFDFRLMRNLLVSIARIPVLCANTQAKAEILEYSLSLHASMKRMSPGNGECLVEATSLLLLSRLIGIKSALVMGFVQVPFCAHAWIEFEGLTFEDVSPYIEIDRIE